MKILIADDHPVFRKGLRALFETEKELEVCGEAEDGREAISLAKQLSPDIVVMDINMPGMNGIEATREIRSYEESTKILALSIHSHKHFVKKMLDAGAVGYLMKDDAPEELLIAIQKVNKGDMYLSSGVTRDALGKDEKIVVPGPPIEEGHLESISIREREILQLIAKGFRNKEIAEKFFISPLTVKKHISNTFQKLNVHSRMKAIEKAKELNIL